MSKSAGVMQNRFFFLLMQRYNKKNGRCAILCNFVQFPIIFQIPPLMASCHASHPGVKFIKQALDK